MTELTALTKQQEGLFEEQQALNLKLKTNFESLSRVTQRINEIKIQKLTSNQFSVSLRILDGFNRFCDSCIEEEIGNREHVDHLYDNMRYYLNEWNEVYKTKNFPCTYIIPDKEIFTRMLKHKYTKGKHSGITFKNIKQHTVKVEWGKTTRLD